MISTYQDMFALCAIALLCLTSVSHSAPPDCKDLVKPLGQPDPRRLEGRWALVADSLKINESPDFVKKTDSITIKFHNLTYSQANRYGDMCYYFKSSNISVDGPTFTTTSEQVNMNGTVIYTSCPDCMVLSLAFHAPNYKSEELCLFSKRREVDDKELKEFRAQVECLKMPEVVVMDPTTELCVDFPTSETETEEKTGFKG
ncbi:uncharacterized protein LOC121942492 [Plectropomus leopardus]|uniref:uncharacterized protein LOC121942492 n=1 Tax=Plectropomus leopardus TaxID=160734 RepID=UPI001C4D9868|nr:uncharacterized protein LOC121942492 [Plectropomus leopardus]